MKRLIVLFLIAFSVSNVSYSAKNDENPQSYEDIEVQWLIELARADTRQARADIVKEVMKLDEAQSKLFWPIFDQYQNEYKKIGDERLSILQTYAANIDSMTDEKANDLAKRSIDNRMQRLELMKKYYNKFSKSLGSIVATRFLQVENVVNMVVDLQIASQVPLMEK